MINHNQILLNYIYIPGKVGDIQLNVLDIVNLSLNSKKQIDQESLYPKSNQIKHFHH